MITGTYPEITAKEAADRIIAEGLITGPETPLLDLNLDKLEKCMADGWQPVYGVFRRKGGPVMGAPGIQFTIKNGDSLSLVPVSLGPQTLNFLRQYSDIRIEYELTAQAA